MANPLEELPGGDMKIGGQSIYVYGLAIGAVAVVYLWVAGRNSGYSDGSTVVAVPDVSGDLGDLPVSTTGDLQDVETPQEGNLEWEVKALAFLVSQGHNPLVAQRALQKYISGETLDYTETLVVNKAIAKYGPAPEGTYGIVKGTTTAPKPASATPVKWKARVGSYKAVGTVNAYTKPDRNSRVKYRRKAGTRINTVQVATVNGETWVRGTSGAIFNASDLVPYQKPKKTAKKK